MQEIKHRLLILFILTFFVSCASLSTEELHEKRYHQYIQHGYSEEDADILAMTKDERLEYLCPYYDIPVDKNNYNLKDKQYRDFIYDLVIGKYGNSYDYPKNMLRTICENHGDIASFYTNARESYNDGLRSIGRDNPAYSDNELFIMQVKAIRIAQEIHDQIHTQGLIKDGMTEYDICRVYFDWLYENLGHHQSKTLLSGNQHMIHDHMYHCFMKETSNCGSRGGAFAVVMHLENIKCQTVIIPGHVMNRVLLDGVEYYVDWGNSFRDIKTPKEWIEYSKTPLAQKYHKTTKDNNYYLEERSILLF